MQIYVDHYAFLVQSLDNSLLRLRTYRFHEDTYDVYDSEGTKESYISMGHERGKLLLMESIAEGPYQRAKQNRGFGLHHIAITVDNFTVFLEQIRYSGWYLHLHSFMSQKHNTLWLARANTPLLLEILEEPTIGKNDTSSFIQTALLSNRIDPKLILALKLPEIQSSLSSDHTFKINDLTPSQ